MDLVLHMSVVCQERHCKMEFGRVVRHGSNPGPQPYLNQPEESNILVETTTVGYNRSQKLVVLFE